MLARFSAAVAIRSNRVNLVVKNQRAYARQAQPRAKMEPPAATPTKRKWPFWAQKLLQIAQNPDSEENAGIVVKKTDKVVVIKDKYPKAKVHLLCIPRTVMIDTPADVRPEHLPILREMFAVAKDVIATHQASNPNMTFRVGFHSSPSMRQLHMHVISTDFDSPALRRGRHWLSFTTAFFLDAAPFIQQIETTGKAPELVDDPEAEEALDDLMPSCVFCKKEFPGTATGIKNIQKHHLEHLANGEKIAYPL